MRIFDMKRRAVMLLVLLVLMIVAYSAGMIPGLS
jgi:hypothetical protein